MKKELFNERTIFTNRNKKRLVELIDGVVFDVSTDDSTEFTIESDGTIYGGWDNPDDFHPNEYSSMVSNLFIAEEAIEIVESTVIVELKNDSKKPKTKQNENENETELLKKIGNLSFSSIKVEGGNTTLNEYIARMPENQNNI